MKILGIEGINKYDDGITDIMLKFELNELEEKYYLKLYDNHIINHKDDTLFITFIENNFHDINFETNVPCTSIDLNQKNYNEVYSWLKENLEIIEFQTNSFLTLK